MRNKVKVIPEKPFSLDENIKPDFKGVLNQYTDYQLTVRKYMAIGGSSMLILTILTGFYFSQIENEPPLTGEQPDEQFISAVMYPIKQPVSFEPIPIDTLSDEGSNKTKETGTTIPPSKIASSKVVDTEPKRKIELEPKLINQNAAPLGGYEKLYEYFARNISYTRLEGNDYIQGVVKIRFSVNPDSSIANLEVIKSLGTGFDQEAMRLVEQMPLWTPAIKNGVPVSQSLTIPIRFEKVN